MFKLINRKTTQVAAGAYIGITLGATDAHAGQDFSTISENIITSIEDLPSLLTGLSYMLGILLGTLGILKIKDHVENPSNAKLQEGAIRLAAGGGLFALPIVIEAMQTTVGDGAGVPNVQVDAIEFN